jgi:hypothetical protein
VIHKWFIMLLGTMVGSQVPAVGQVSAPQIVLAQKPVAPAIKVFRVESSLFLAPSLLLSQGRENTLAHTSLRYPGHERNHRLERLSPVVKLKTLILTQVSLPLVQLWDGKLQLDAFQGTAHSEWAVWRFKLPRHAGFSFFSTKFSWRVAFGPSLRRQSELSFWPGRADAKPEAGMEVCAANFGRSSKLKCIAVTPNSPWMFDDEEENQERTGRSHPRQRQERNGEATHGKVLTRRGIEGIRWANHAGQTCKDQAAVSRASSATACKVVCALLA